MNCKVERQQKQSSLTYAQDTIKNGYLQVKLPTNLRGFVGQWKAWSKNWIEINFQSNDPDKNNISVCLSVFRNQKSGSNGLRNFIYQINFQPENAVIFRCKSQTQTYAFTICNNSEPVIHLAAGSEIESQLWMQSLRKSLWPPNPLMELENSLKGHFYASIIDNENSHRSGLLGAYGYLQVSARKLILTHPQTGHVIQEWSFESFTLSNPFNRILQITPNKSTFSTTSQIFFFCFDANEVIKRINHEKEFIRFAERSSQQLEHRFVNFSSSLPKNFNYSSLSSETNTSNSNICDYCNTFRIRSAKEIPETMLDCSFSLNSLPINHILSDQVTENIYNEPFESSDDIEKIYEEIVIKECVEDSCDGVKNTRFSDDSPPELPPKKRVSSNPITIRYNDSTSENFAMKQRSKSLTQNKLIGNEIANYDMFSTILRQTVLNISSLNSQKLLNKSSNVVSKTIEKENLNQELNNEELNNEELDNEELDNEELNNEELENLELENDYYEMRAICIEVTNKKSNLLSDTNDYVDMRSFLI